MPKMIFIANWKMNLGLKETVILIKQLLGGLKKIKNNLEIVICPSFTVLSEASKLLKKGNIKLGSQDVFWEEKGAYTGNISPKMLKEIGCEYVIIGHSERRQYLGETDEMAHQKIKAAIKEGLIPILCVGETFEERQEGQKDYIIIKQVTKALEGISLSRGQKIIIAYEPVWVIGSGQAVKPEEAEYTNQIIKQSLIDLYPRDIVEQNFRIIYGGSVDSSVIKSFVERSVIDGVLVGGASLKTKDFIKMINKIHPVK
ncbi:MAG: triosephosphate isomerase (TIM) [Parcubacteria group bacterium Athens1014_10]|nr:MAG: triosephosphate isomerase (TIM) [Parcubacteria group bacterium Athens1014_10]TSD04993.1 MAG: triosephosphate isomerase (TIM) [Parcubacteria group bacterium Athens0714_12]